VLLATWNRFLDRNTIDEGSCDVDHRIEPHPIGESEFDEMNPFVYEIQRSDMHFSGIFRMSESNYSIAKQKIHFDVFTVMAIFWKKK